MSWSSDTGNDGAHPPDAVLASVVHGFGWVGIVWRRVPNGSNLCNWARRHQVVLLPVADSYRVVSLIVKKSALGQECQCSQRQTGRSCSLKRGLHAQHVECLVSGVHRT